MTLVPLLNPKFATVPAERSCELRVRGTRPAFQFWSLFGPRTGIQCARNSLSRRPRPGPTSMSNAPNPPPLAELRAEIDRIDEEMHRLLMQRGEIIDRLIQVKRTEESGSAFRP